MNLINVVTRHLNFLQFASIAKIKYAHKNGSTVLTVCFIHLTPEWESLENYVIFHHQESLTLFIYSW